ncbi:pectin lyase fold/virulence factor [Nemania abortiva]|nr:pectin lyase fold/virulence factor [Nemania abortiva]
MIEIPGAVQAIPLNTDFTVEIQPLPNSTDDAWSTVPAYSTDVADVDLGSNVFNRHQVAIASFDFEGAVQVRVWYLKGDVRSAAVRPLSAGISPLVKGNCVTFTLDSPRDVMLEINGNKWHALHLITNEIDADTPTGDSDDIWYFGPGLNNGSAYSRVTDGVNLDVPSGKTVFLASGAFVTFRVNFRNATHSAVRGHGFIYSPQGGYAEREWGGAIHMTGSSNILVQGVTSIGAMGFSLSAGECRTVHVDRYRSFSFAGNGDGIDFFCSSDILIENCFLRNSDDTIALYSHRWQWYGDSSNITIRNCVLLPDIAHAINMGTHGNPDKPEMTTNVLVQNIDILDHDENQVWYQGCMAINAADENTFENIRFEDIRVERITRGQLFNLRTMMNSMWTTAPGRAIRNVLFKNVSLDMERSKVVNPSQIIGYNQDRLVENITFDNLVIGNRAISDNMVKPRWFSVYDFVPVFVNEHVSGIQFKNNGD